MMSLVLALLAQVGPFVTPGVGAEPASPLPPEVIEQKEKEHERQRQQRDDAAQPFVQPVPQSQGLAAPSAPSALGQCLALTNQDPARAVDMAQAWLQKVKGAPAAPAQHCLGVALGRLERWGEAEKAFYAARDAAGTDKLARARFGAMAGNAALAQGANETALAALDAAHADAVAANDKGLAADVAIDRARALVGLKRDDDAAAALAEARATRPADPEAWLLSATLSRRMNRLAEAQAQIEKAAALSPLDPAVGLEAGVIAVLGGRDEAARKSWQSVIAAAPDSAAATTAKGYLAQLGTGGRAKP